MRISNKPSIITGVVLLLLAALFSISLLTLPLNLGFQGNQNNIFNYLGDMLYSFYGFSSILIPAFLLVAGLFCFTSTWTARKTMRFLTAIVPFFTIVITENICRSVISQNDSEFVALKISVSIITGIMLVIIEFLGIGIIADKVNAFFFGDKSSKQKSSSEPTLRKFSVPKILKSENKNQKEEEKTEIQKNVDIYEPEALTINENAVLEQQPEEVVSLINEIKEFKNVSLEDNDKTQIAEDEPEVVESEFVEEKSEPENQSSLITQEEYAALTIANEEILEDELKWDNLPPVPETLPPEYDEDVVIEEEIDENDPALQFPPVEDYENEIEENVFEEEIVDSQNEIIEKYSDKQFPKSNFPSGIKFESSEVQEEKKTLDSSKSEYPAGIRLDENSDDTDFGFVDDFVETPDFAAEEEDAESKKSDFERELEKPAIENEKFAKKIRIRDELAMHGNNTPGITTKTLASSAVAAAIPVSSSVKSVFSDMENDIRKDYNIVEKEESFIDDSEVEEDFDEENEKSELENFFDNADFLEKEIEEFNQIDDEVEEESEMNIRNSSARNLTADELSDFFSSQQIENTPKTKAIEGNPAKIGNRAIKKGPYVIPSNLLTAYKDDQYWIIDEQTKNASLSLKQTLSEFNIEAEIIGIKKGPVVTMFEILPAPGVKLSKIVALQDNIALALAAQSVRIVAPIPGKQAVGIEVPNKNRSVVGFREIIEMDLPEWKKMAVPVILGKDILGKAQLIDLVKTPHMLIAGATGSGKSVCVNSLILSILYKRSYQDVKMILVDPKVVELKLYNNIPHLLTPVITEPKKALQALQYCLCEMERRYALLDGMGVRDISNYNAKIKEQNICTEKLPYIVVIIDEFADLMATSGKELESIVARLTAMSRAVGIHLVLATQRPSVNVITGLIKANIPTRIAFMVASRTDSNIIIDTVGAEKLLGRGDMLYASAVDPAPIRIQGTFVSDQEVENVVNAVKEFGEPDYIDEEIFVEDDDEAGARDLFGEPIDDDDPLYDQALQVVVQAGKASASYIQRRLKIGYNRAARLVEEMEERGIVGPANGSKPREIIHYP